LKADAKRCNKLPANIYFSIKGSSAKKRFLGSSRPGQEKGESKDTDIRSNFVNNDL
jgi:hypothetical protein